MNKSVILIGALATAVSVPTLAADGVLKDAYVSVKIGANITDLNADRLSSPLTSEYYDLSSDDNKSLVIGAVAFGWNLEPSLHVPVRTELEYSVQEAHRFDSTYIFSGGYLKDSLKLNQQSIMWNTYIDWKNKTKFTPYLGVGIGATRIYAKSTLSREIAEPINFGTTSRSNDNFVWSVGVGTSYAITPNLVADLSYKYIDSGKFTQYYSIFGTNDVTTNYKLSANNFALGLRYSF